MSDATKTAEQINAPSKGLGYSTVPRAEFENLLDLYKATLAQEIEYREDLVRTVGKLRRQRDFLRAALLRVASLGTMCPADPNVCNCDQHYTRRALKELEDEVPE